MNHWHFLLQEVAREDTYSTSFYIINLDLLAFTFLLLVRGSMVDSFSRLVSLDWIH